MYNNRFHKAQIGTGIPPLADIPFKGMFDPIKLKFLKPIEKKAPLSTMSGVANYLKYFDSKMNDTNKEDDKKSTKKSKTYENDENKMKIEEEIVENKNDDEKMKVENGEIEGEEGEEGIELDDHMKNEKKIDNNNQIENKILSIREIKKRKREEKILKNKLKNDEKYLQYDPSKYTNVTENAYATLFISNIPYEITSKKLQKEFEPYGPIKTVILPQTPDGKSRGYGFIEFVHSNDMESCVHRLKDYPKRIDGRKVIIDVERGRTVKNWRPMRLGGGLGGRNTKKPDHFVASSYAPPVQAPSYDRKRSARSSSRDRPMKQQRRFDDYRGSYRPGSRDRGDRDRDNYRDGDRDRDRDRDRGRRGDSRNRPSRADSRGRSRDRHYGRR